MCTDGISNVMKIESLVTTIENNDVCMFYFFNLVPLESINSIIQLAKQEYRKNTYCPDMTVILKNLNIKNK